MKFGKKDTLMTSLFNECFKHGNLIYKIILFTEKLCHATVIILPRADWRSVMSQWSLHCHGQLVLLQHGKLTWTDSKVFLNLLCHVTDIHSLGSKTWEFFWGKMARYFSPNFGITVIHRSMGHPNKDQSWKY